MNRGDDRRNCGGCEFWDIAQAWGERKDKAPCRINPPSIKASGMQCDANAQWPNTTRNDWCGEFEPRDRGEMMKTPLPAGWDDTPELRAKLAEFIRQTARG